MRLSPLKMLAVTMFVGVSACSSGDSDTAAKDSAAASQPAFDTAAANAAVAPQAGIGAAAPVTVADIDRWQRGMVAELKAVQGIGAQLKAARNANDSMNAMFGANEMSTAEAGAAAAGLGIDRYKFIRTNLSVATGSLSPIEMEMSTEGLTPEMLADLQKGRVQTLERMSTDVPADVVEALRPRAAELRKQAMTLVGERLRASGAA